MINEELNTLIQSKIDCIKLSENSKEKAVICGKLGDELEGIKQALCAMGYTLEVATSPYVSENAIPSNFKITPINKTECWEDEHVQVHWCLEDILHEVKKYSNLDATEDNCRKVSLYLRKTHNAAIGINWDVIKAAIEECFPDAERIGCELVTGYFTGEIPVKCNWCDWAGIEEELFVDVENEIDYCPSCRKSGFLMTPDNSLPGNDV